MKKLLVAFGILCASVTFGQTRYQIYQVNSGPWNAYTHQFDVSSNQVNMTMTFDNSVIRVYDEAHSVYIVRNHVEIQNDSQAVISKWDGVDERGRSVGVYIGQNRTANAWSLIIQYNDFMFQYFFIRNE